MIFVLLCFSAQIFTPLRLHPDAVVLLSIADSAAHGGGFLFHGEPSVFPPGYPALLAFLLKLGIARVWVIVAINVCLLFVGLFALQYVLESSFFKDQRYVWAVFFLSLFSFVFIRFVAMPLTDVPFFALAACSLAAMEYTSRVRVRRSFWLTALGSLVLILGSIALRRIGIVLIPPFLWLVFSTLARSPLNPRFKRRNRLILGSLTLGAVLLLGWIFVYADSAILKAFEDTVRGRSLRELALSVFDSRLQELAEIAVNVPVGVLPKSVRSVLPWIGALSLAAIAMGVIRKRKALGPTEIFAVGYCAVLFTWPYYDPRFWLPLLPLLLAYCILAIQSVIASGREMPRRCLGAYVTLYAVLGMTWLISSTMVTFSRPVFANTYMAKKEYRPAYCVAFGSCANNFDPKAADPNLVHLLRVYR